MFSKNFPLTVGLALCFTFFMDHFLQVVLFKQLSQGEIVKEAFFPPFEAIKVRLEVGQGTKCMKMELYFYDAGKLPYIFTTLLLDLRSIRPLKMGDTPEWLEIRYRDEL